jgi:hypothetical protein
MSAEPRTKTTNSPCARVKRADQLTQTEKNFRTVLTDGDGNGRAYTERRNVHDVLRVAEHDGGHGTGELNNWLRFLADGRTGRAEQRRRRPPFGERRWASDSKMFDGMACSKTEVKETGLAKAGRVAAFSAVIFMPSAGLENIHHHQTDDQRERGGNFKIGDGLERDAAHGFQFACRRDAVNQSSEEQGPDDRFDQPQKNVADGRELDGKSREENTDQNANDERDENPRGEAQFLQ